MDRKDRAMAMNGTPHVLIIAGSDSSGGAGIVRDIETVTAFGVKSCVAITAVTAQTHDFVQTVQPVDAALVAAQMRTALSANAVNAIKIGMLATGATVTAVAQVLTDHPQIPVILDPVIAASSGRLLLDEGGIAIMLQKLVPLCTLITPNLPELQVLAARGTNADIASHCEQLLARGARAVLAKGGHDGGEECVDTLFQRDTPPLLFRSPRYGGTVRGTGCMLASGIAANLALGKDLASSIEEAKNHVSLKFSHKA